MFFEPNPLDHPPWRTAPPYIGDNRHETSSIMVQKVGFRSIGDRVTGRMNPKYHSPHWSGQSPKADFSRSLSEWRDRGAGSRYPDSERRPRFGCVSFTRSFEDHTFSEDSLVASVERPAKAVRVLDGVNLRAVRTSPGGCHGLTVIQSRSTSFAASSNPTPPRSAASSAP
jgi:hypothetical protein